MMVFHLKIFRGKTMMVFYFKFAEEKP